MQPGDLDWWLELDKQLEWTFAKTYADTAPHEYVVLDRTDGIGPADFVRAARVIQTFGQPGKFWNTTRIYLTHQGRKWWTMDSPLTETTLINRASADKVYGRQDAPATATGTFTEYDAIATVYDTIRDRSRDQEIARRIVEVFGDHVPTTLDVGCGTGALLDLGLLSPALYTGIDESRAMLNTLVRKHPGVHRVLPGRFQDVAGLGDSYELVVALDVPAIDVEDVQHLASDLLIVL